VGRNASVVRTTGGGSVRALEALGSRYSLHPYNSTVSAKPMHKLDLNNSSMAGHRLIDAGIEFRTGSPRLRILEVVG
jgi:hypothetical protein